MKMDVLFEYSLSVRTCVKSLRNAEEIVLDNLPDHHTQGLYIGSSKYKVNFHRYRSITNDNVPP